MEAVIGSRGITDFDFRKLHLTHVISGGAAGIDKAIAEFARANGIPMTEIKPDYSQGRWAPLIRNREIIALADKIHAIWDGTSKGTRHVITLALQKKKPLEVFIINEHGETRITDPDAIRHYIGAHKVRRDRRRGQKGGMLE